LTKEDPDSANWAWSRVIDDTGAVTAFIDRMQDSNSGKLWLYFGTGRYFYKLPNATDDPTSQRRLYGIKEPCYSSDAYDISKCADPVLGKVLISDLEDVTSDAAAAAAVEDAEGWYIDLETTPPAGYDAERVITDPLATTTGAVYFTTFEPSTDICGFGGTSYLWGIKYNTGGSASAAGLTKGKALIQVSTGSIEEKDLKDAFKENPVTNPDSKADRRTAGFEGKPPEGPGLLILTQPPPLENIMHIMEK